MRILYIIDFFHPHVGGVPTFFKNLAENVSKMGHKVTVVTTHANGTKKFEKHNGIKIYRFGKSREQFMIGATMFLLKNREKFDIVHTSTYSAMIPSYTFTLFKKIPQVLSDSGLSQFQLTGGLRYTLQFGRVVKADHVPELHNRSASRAEMLLQPFKESSM